MALAWEESAASSGSSCPSTSAYTPPSTSLALPLRDASLRSSAPPSSQPPPPSPPTTASPLSSPLPRSSLTFPFVHRPVLSCPPSTASPPLNPSTAPTSPTSSPASSTSSTSPGPCRSSSHWQRSPEGRPLSGGNRGGGGGGGGAGKGGGSGMLTMPARLRSLIRRSVSARLLLLSAALLVTATLGLLLSAGVCSTSSSTRRACSSALARQLPTFLSLPSSDYHQSEEWSAATSTKHRRLPALLSVHASEHLMGGMPLLAEGGGSPADAVDGDEEGEEQARLIERYQREFAAEWAEEQRWKRSPSARPPSAPPSQLLLPSGRSRTGEELRRTASALPPSLVLPAASHAAKRGKASSSSSPIVRPSFAVAVLLSLTSELCRAAWLQYRSLHRIHPGEFDYVVTYETSRPVDEWRQITSDPHCRLLFAHSTELASMDEEQQTQPTLASTASDSSAPIGRVRFFPVHPLRLPSWSAPRFARWSYCYNKLALLGLDDYSKVLYLDADVLIAAPLSSFFSLPYQMAAGLDTAQNCRKAHTKLNAGVWLFTPSTHLHTAFLTALHDRTASCISGVLEEAEQELLNCMCGMGQHGEPALPIRPELVCGLLPYYANVVPSYSDCAEYSADDVLLLHFADLPKPWQWEDQQCRAVAVDATWEREEAWFRAEERRRCFTSQLHALTFYHCMEGGRQRSMQLPIDRDCRLINIDEAPQRTHSTDYSQRRLRPPAPPAAAQPRVANSSHPG